MPTHFKPVNTAIQEMTPWNLEEVAEPFELSNPTAEYAVIIVMAGDDKSMGGQVFPDIGEMRHGVMGEDEISVLALADFKGRTFIIEITDKGINTLAELESAIDTGDPRPISDFLARAFKSYSEETRISLGFWGHGSGVFRDLDPNENLIPDAMVELPIGTPFTKTMFLENYLAEPVQIKANFSRGMLPDGTTGGILTNRELSSALAVAFSRSGRNKPAELLFFDK